MHSGNLSVSIIPGICMVSMSIISAVSTLIFKDLNFQISTDLVRIPIHIYSCPMDNKCGVFSRRRAYGPFLPMPCRRSAASMQKGVRTF